MALSSKSTFVTRSIGELWHLQSSPWSIRVLWTLSVCGVRAELRPYRPLLDAPALWMRLGFPLRGPTLTVPVLFPASSTPDRRPRAPPLRSSYEIARFIAAEAGDGHLQRLFPVEREAEILRIVEHAGCVLTFGRGLKNAFLRSNLDAASKQLLPPYAQNSLGPRLMLRPGLWAFGLKYAPTSREEATLALDAIRAALQANAPSGYTCGGSFTFADICAALCIIFGTENAQGLPVARELATEYGDLVEWRRKIIAQHFELNEKQVFSLNPTVKDRKSSD
jgi:glutathione S-transferase